MQLEGKPVHLSATINVDPNSDGVGNQKALKNPHPIPIEIHEVKVQIRDVVSGAALKLSLGCGDQLITNDFIPVFCLGTARLVETEAGSSNIELAWRLSKPIIVDPGAGIAAKVLHTGIVADSLTSLVSFSGRTIRRAPAKRYLPYVAAWQSDQFTVFGTSEETSSSGEQDLANALDVPVMVERFVGRVNTYDADTAINSDLDPSAALRMLTLTMLNSRGEQVVKNPALFGQVFNRLTRSWEVPHLVAPGEYYLANLTKAAATDQGNNNDIGQAFISMVGHRELRRGA